MIGKIITLIFLSSVFVALMMHSTKSLEASSLHLTAFKNWIQEYSASFGEEEFQYRLSVFTENLNKINQHNNNENNQWWMSINQFAAMTHEEFVSTQLGLINAPQSENVQTIESTFNGDIDWRTKGAVTPVKNQGQCGSCWAFSATGNMEGVSAIAGSGLLSLSEQELVDCSGSYGNQGCNGGWMDYAFQYTIDHGLNLESAYPYEGVTKSCRAKQAGAFKVKSFTDVPAGDCATLAKGLSVEPVSIAVDANNWQFYGGGVFSNCGASLDHGVLLVGQTSSFNIVKNSWAKSWGEQGYIRLALGNTCGMCNAASWTNLK